MRVLDTTLHSAKLRRSSIVGLALYVGILAGCGARQRPVSAPGVTAVRSAGPTVTVRNRQWIDAWIYVMTASGNARRLGLVPRLGSGVFALPANVDLPAELTFFAVPLGTDDRLIVGPVRVDLGSRLLFTIDKSESSSTVVMRP